MRAAEAQGEARRTNGMGQHGGSRGGGPPSPACPLDVPGADRLSVEARAVLLAARLAPPEADLEVAAALAEDPEFDWDRWFDLACRLWLHPTLALVALDRHNALGGVVPDDVRSRLELAVFAARARWRSYVHLLGPVLWAWKDEEIPVLALKGAALQATVFPVGSRLLNDVDLFVPPERIEDAHRVLVAAGFRRHHPEGGILGEPAWTYLRSEEGGLAALTVDLHRRLVPGRAAGPLDGTDCAAAGADAMFGDVPIRVPSPEDSVVLAGVHIAKDMAVKALAPADLAAVYRGGGGYPGVDPERLVARAGEAGAEGATGLALRWARAAGAAVPDGLIARLEGAARGSLAANAVLFDARALVSTHRLRTVARFGLKGAFAGRSTWGWSAHRDVVRDVFVGSRDVGRSRFVAALEALRGVALVAPAAAAAAASARRLRAGDFEGAARMNDVLWPESS